MIATPTWGTSSSITEYFNESKDNYYKQEGDLGQWQGKAAKSLGFNGAITEEHLQNALLGKNANGEKALKQVKINDKGERERAGLDLTYNAPKSVSIAYELAKATGNEKLAQTILDIHNNAVTKSLTNVEKRYSQSRETKDGVTEHINTGNLAIAKFQHDTARPVTDEKGNVTVDPSLHTHAVIMNMTKSKDGTYKAIESKEIYANYMAEGMNYRATMAAELAKAGFEIRVTDENKGFYEIGLTGDIEKDEKIIESQSLRSRQIEEALPALREKHPNKSESELKQMAAHQTREFKGEVDRDAVRADNLQRAKEAGLDINNINNLAQKIETQKEVLVNMTPEEKEAKNSSDLNKAKDAVNAALIAITQEKSVFKEEDLTVIAQKFLLNDAVDPKTLEKAIKQQTREKSDLKLLDIGNNHFTTKEILGKEKEVLDALKESKDTYKPSHSKARAKRELEEYSSKQKFSLTKGQFASAAHILTSKDSIIGIQGDAGTGKTYLLKAVNELKGDTKIYGLSYTGKAAKEIENATKEAEKATKSEIALKSSGIESSTIASFLNKIESGRIDKEEFKGAKLIVDEASMLGIKDTTKLLDFAKESGAQIVLIGDVKQFKAINAGDPFSLMQNNGMKTENMSEVLRQTDKTLIKAVAELNNYNTDKAFDTLDKANVIHQLRSNEDVVDKIKEEYFSTMKNPNEPNETLAVTSVKDTLKNNIILTQTNEVKDKLNKTIRSEMQEQGVVSKEEFKFTTKESSKIGPSEKYFAKNYNESTNVFIQDTVFTKDNETELKKGNEYKIAGTDTKNNTLELEDKEKNKYIVDLKQHSQSIQAYSEVERSFAKGDKIVFEKNDKKVGVENGTIGTIKSIDKDGNFTIKTEDKSINFNIGDYDYLNHGYAVTTYKAQGASAKNVIAYMPAKGQNANSFYVTATRAVESLKIFTDSKEDLKSAIHNEQIKDNALTLNSRVEKKEAARVEKQKEAHETRKLSREEAYNNAPASEKQLAFADSIAKQLGIENPEIGKRANTDKFIKENIESYQASKENIAPSGKQSNYAQTIADKLYDDIDTSKMNVRQTKDYIANNAETFKEANKNPVEYMLSIDTSNFTQVQEDKYFKDLVHAELVSAYKKDIESLERLDKKHEEVFPQTSLEEKQLKLDLYAIALDIKPKDYLEVMQKEHVGLQHEENIQKYKLDTPLGVAKELRDQGLNYQDEKYKATADIVLERQFDRLMDAHNGTNDKELEERNERMIKFVQGYKEQLEETRVYEGKIEQIEEYLENGDVYRAVEMIEENRESLEEFDLEQLEKAVEKTIDSELENVEIEEEIDKEFLQDELIVDLDNQIEELSDELEIDMSELDELYEEVLEERELDNKDNVNEEEYEYER